MLFSVRCGMFPPGQVGATVAPIREIAQPRAPVRARAGRRILGLHPPTGSMPLGWPGFPWIGDWPPSKRMKGRRPPETPGHDRASGKSGARAPARGQEETCRAGPADCRCIPTSTRANAGSPGPGKASTRLSGRRTRSSGRRSTVGCVALEITQRCNLDCTLCYLSESSESVKDVPIGVVFERRIDADPRDATGPA